MPRDAMSESISRTSRICWRRASPARERSAWRVRQPRCQPLNQAITSEVQSVTVWTASVERAEEERAEEERAAALAEQKATEAAVRAVTTGAGGGGGGGGSSSGKCGTGGGGAAGGRVWAGFSGVRYDVCLRMR